jgi:hypothetical protein
MSGSGEGFGDFDEDCICVESCAGDVSNLFMTFVLSNLNLAAKIHSPKKIFRNNKLKLWLRFNPLKGSVKKLKHFQLCRVL